MIHVGLTIASVLAVLWTSQAAAPLPLMCNKIVTPASYPVNRMIQKYKLWEVIYVPDGEAYATVTSEFRLITAACHNKTSLRAKINMQDYSVSMVNYSLTYKNDIFYKDYVDDEGHEFHSIAVILASTSEGALLYYVCPNTGGVGVDLRYILHPVGAPFSIADENHLLGVDTSCKFEGRLRKLQNTII